MQHWITTEHGHLKAKLFNRESAEEMLEFIRAVALENQNLRLATVLMDIRGSRPLFHFSGNGFLDDLKRLSAEPACRIALLGDTVELRLSNDYLALLARQQGLNVRSFRNELAALKWLSERRSRQERRRESERRATLAERTESLQRRRQQRRSARESAHPMQ
jgi:hypothetical protein